MDPPHVICYKSSCLRSEALQKDSEISALALKITFLLLVGPEAVDDFALPCYIPLLCVHFVNKCDRGVHPIDNA